MKDWTIGTRSLRYRAPDARAGKLGARHALAARIDALIGAAIALLAFWLYTWTLLPGLGSRDTAELQWTEGPRYLQLVEGLRPDLQLVSAVSRSALREALHHGRAVYLTKPDLSLGFAQAPAGLLWQVVDAPLAAVTSTHLQWDAGMALTGYTLPAGPYAPGTPVPVTLQWEAKAAPSAAYTLFVHLVAEDGTIWGQHDAPPASAPTDRWRAGDRLLELCLPALKPDAPPGRYRVTLGWYEYPSLRRPNLVRFGQPTAPGNYVTLGTIEVAADSR